ncbi:uncharacterized protein LOC143275422 [Babylonia areolata]|uniref:uncharacterized protein LOC143275422 n=1 Tax=Babylonia areolata TaxID=304850 RepID=UPI003FD30D52
MMECAQCGKHGGGGGDGGGDTIRICTGCHVTGYCSRECQRRHWKRHKKECRSVSEKESVTAGPREATNRVSEDGSSADGHFKTCQKCGIQRLEMKKCGSCQQVTYCSRDCQRADWKTHRDTCRKTPAEDAETTERKELARPRRQSDGEPEEAVTTRAESAVALLSSAVSRMQVGPPESLSWEEARSRAQHLYPLHRIIDRVWALKKDCGGPVGKESVVALLKIRGRYPHFCRIGRCLEDVEGTPSFVLFHTPPNTLPHFRYEQLQDGNFLCYKHAFLHFFLDGTVGLKIEEARDVCILEPTTTQTKQNAPPTSSSSHHPPPSPPLRPTAAAGGGAGATTTTTTTTTAEEVWNRARSQAQRLFPDKQVVDSFRDVDYGSLGHYEHLLFDGSPTWDPDVTLPLKMGRMKEVLVLRLESPLGRLMCHDWVAKDRSGKTARLNLGFSGTLRFEDLKNGQFLCLYNPSLSTNQKEDYEVSMKEGSSFEVIDL